MLFFDEGGRMMQEEKFLHTVVEQLTVDKEQGDKITASIVGLLLLLTVPVADCLGTRERRNVRTRLQQAISVKQP
jgi:hypothetical protein